MCCAEAHTFTDRRLAGSTAEEEALSGRRNAHHDPFRRPTRTSTDRSSCIRDNRPRPAPRSGRRGGGRGGRQPGPGQRGHAVEAGKYDASAIQVLEGLEAVRKRPGMYIGSTGERGLHHLVWEVVDNSVDEALAGFCDLHRGDDPSPTVPSRSRDNGRGIPVDVPPGPGAARGHVVLTVLHAGGKFGGGGYKVSGGLHGVGVSVVNALSSRKVEVDIRRDGYRWTQSFSLGVPDGPLERHEGRPRRETGTTTRFWPSEDIFETTDL